MKNINLVTTLKLLPIFNKTYSGILTRLITNIEKVYFHPTHPAPSSTKTNTPLCINNLINKKSV